MIDEGLDEWPEEVYPALQPFVQGHLIEEPPFVYGADLRYPIWSASSALADETPEADRGLEAIELAPEDRPPYGIIATQTCDLTEEGRDPLLQPFFEVYPVYRVEEGDRRLTRQSIHRLDPPDLGDGIWIADFRIRLPIEKGALVGREPIEAFPDEGGYLDFSKEMVRRGGRPALATVFNELFSGVARSINGDKDTKKLSRIARDEIHSCRLAIEDGDRLNPAAARLYIFSAKPLSQDAEEWFRTWWDEARTVAEKYGLELLPVQSVSVDSDEFDLKQYDSLVEVRISF